ncbi:winged helix DNA-binding protein [Arthrobacter sp. S39]|uniref:MarR family winged helix-turn-helix transcriptional regulator n=1 Tax=Arthrobacter sp. S39 TaxID=2509720 RepID=UPI0010373B92|nr:winged helix DNA-binding protein [Arthrobacter sp. S39]TAP45852.1 MarR family transcriptional regulator [Arthrobacter sp. S39]
MSPILGPDNAGLRVAMHALVTWSTATSSRERLMHESGFPLPGDLPAFLLVNQLIYRGAVRPSDVADAIQTGTSNISKIVRRLEEARIVRRMPDPRDDRAVVIVLTAEGRAVAQRISDAIDRVSAPATVGWTSEEFKLLESLMLKLVRSLDALPGAPLSTASGVSLGPKGRNL